MSIIKRDDLIDKYKEFKNKNNKTPLAKEFCKYAGIHRRKLEQIYGDNAYSQLQMECGDEPSKLNLVRIPLENIMRQYGDLAMKTIKNKKLPVQANWTHEKLRPTISGLEHPPHLIRWSDFPMKFKGWVDKEGIKGYSKVLEYIDSRNSKSNSKFSKSNLEFDKLIKAVRDWSPALRRNSEESYKIELRKHLESMNYSINEEHGESKVDLLVNAKYAIEIKKDPNLSEYDRLFGQLARHLQHKSYVIALLMDVPVEDKYQNFIKITDKYLNKDNRLVEIIKK